MKTIFKTGVTTVFMLIGMAFIVNAQQSNNAPNGAVVIVGQAKVDGTFEQYLVNMEDGGVYREEGSTSATFVGQFDSEELSALNEKLKEIDFKGTLPVYEGDAAYSYLLIMHNGQEYSASWVNKAPDNILNFYNHLNSRCGLLRMDYSIAY